MCPWAGVKIRCTLEVIPRAAGAAARVLIALNATALFGLAAVVRDGSHIANCADFEPLGLQATECAFAAGAGTTQEDVEVTDAVFLGSLGGAFSSKLSGERSALAGALEAGLASRRPGNGVALCIGDGDDGVVEAAVDVGGCGRNVLAVLALHRAGAGSSGFLLRSSHV